MHYHHTSHPRDYDIEMGDIVQEVRRVTAEFSKFLDVAIEEYKVTSLCDNENDNKFPTTDDDFPGREPSAESSLDGIGGIKDTADIAEELTSECGERRGIIREYRLSANDLIRQYETAIVNINCEECRKHFCNSIRDTEAILQRLFTKCSTNPDAGTDVIERFRNSTIESFKILQKCDRRMRHYNEKESDTGRSSEDEFELKITMELLKSFYRAFTYITGIVTTMLEAKPEQETRNYLKRRTTDLSQSTNKMIIYIESYLLYNYLMGKLNNMERMMDEMKSCDALEVTKKLQILSSEARDLTVTFKRLVNHFEMKRSANTSGELIRSSFSLEKSAKAFAFNARRTQFLMNASNRGKKQQPKMDFTEEFIDKARFILNLFLAEIHKIVKT